MFKEGGRDDFTARLLKGDSSLFAPLRGSSIRSVQRGHARDVPVPTRDAARGVAIGVR